MQISAVMVSHILDGVASYKIMPRAALEQEVKRKFNETSEESIEANTYLGIYNYFSTKFWRQNEPLTVGKNARVPYSPPGRRMIDIWMEVDAGSECYPPCPIWPPPGPDGGSGTESCTHYIFVGFVYVHDDAPSDNMSN